MYDEVAFLLYSLVKFYKPALIVQTGHLWGKSACMMLEAITDGFLTGTRKIEEEEQNGDLQFSRFVQANAPTLDGDPRVISVDPGPLNVPRSVQGTEYLQSRYPKAFEFHQIPSGEFFRSCGDRLRKQFHGKRILGVVDGDHSAQGCIQDLIALEDLGAGLIFLDDVTWLPHLGSVGKTFARKYGYDLLRLPLYNGVAVLMRRQVVHSGASRLWDRMMASVWNMGGTLGFRLARRTGNAPLIRRTAKYIRRVSGGHKPGPAQ
jgi:hypothetical protein